jgi:6-phosphogluconolactonase
MARYLIGGYGPDMQGTASGISWGLSHADGRFEYGGLAIAMESPSWLTVNGTTAYAALEGAGEVSVSTLAGVAPALVERRSSGGRYPCHIAVDGNAVIVANYGDGAVAVLRPDAAPQVLAGSGSGSLPAQEGPHAHHVLVHEGRVLTLDLGADLLHVHHWHGTELVRIDSVPLPPGTGPRDLLALPDGRIALLGEWSCELLLLEPMGDTFEVVQIVSLPGATQGTDQASALALSSDGRFVVAGIRGSNRVATVALDVDAARPVGWAPSGGEWPRHLVADGEFVHVANQLSNSVATLRLDAHGILTPVGEPVAVPSPTCLVEVKTATKF